TGADLAGAIHTAEPDLQVRLVIGPWGSQSIPDGVVGVQAPSSLSGEMAGAQIVVSAGGVALLEACRLARAVVAVTMAENQRTAVEYLHRVGAVLAVADDEVATAVSGLRRDAAARRALARAAAEAIDGQGAARAAAQLVEQAADVRNPVRTF
ncbi:MAG TPA: hypothetical protein VFX21_02780, partial [Acidimicrobiia bacterium]|nr:hypothetical protein [Acidimicrobiia bacterium]